MGSIIDRYVPGASTFAADIDGIITLIAVLVGFWGVLAEMLLIGLVIAFREKPGVKAQYITGDEKHQKAWIAFPHYLVLACDVLVIISAVRVWYHVKQELPVADETVKIISQQWAWSFVHAGPDKRLDTADDIATVDDLHVQVGKVYHFKLEARDVMHSFSVPAFRLKQDAVPGRVITGWFEPTRTGTFDIQCAEICGIGHGLMPARIVVESADEHAAWMARNAPTSVAAATTAATTTP
jgi:cytochrome c oxidase subunit 2